MVGEVGPDFLAKMKRMKLKTFDTYYVKLIKMKMFGVGRVHATPRRHANSSTVYSAGQGLTG